MFNQFNESSAQPYAKLQSVSQLLIRILGKANSKAVEKLLQERSLAEIGQMNLIGLRKYFGPAAAQKLIAVMELSRRKQLEAWGSRRQIRNSADSYHMLAPILGDLNHEECWILCLNRANYVVSKVMISKGGNAGTIVDAKQVFTTALEQGASSIIIAHNHPSGSLTPSVMDIDLTHSLYQAGKVMTLPLLDHIIVTSQGYYSFADEGALTK